MLRKEFPQLRNDFWVNIGMSSSLRLSQALALAHLRSQTIESFCLIKIKIVAVYSPFNAFCVVVRLARQGGLRKINTEKMY